MHLQIKQVVVERGIQAVRLLKGCYTLFYDTCSFENSPNFLMSRYNYYANDIYIHRLDILPSYYYTLPNYS